jgi:1-deoxy-D-xylulose-5-phosphate reductoisomerase
MVQCGQGAVVTGQPRRVAVLGATGSIGRQTLEVAAAHPDRLRVVALAASASAAEVVAAARRHAVEAVALADPAAASAAEELLRRGDGRGAPRPAVLAGPEGVCELAAWPTADVVVAAISGVAGLLPALAAVRAGRRVALANKEALVAAGPLLLRAAAASGAELVPVDSEHSAIWQALRGHDPSAVRRLVLTASGGPFRGRSRDEIEAAAPEAALRHPNWRMGPRITVDSATLMNKGFEVIEAHHLFGLPAEPGRIAVVVHPESIVHSLVEFVDGTLLGQFSLPDMRLPIQYALSHPERWGVEGLGARPLDLAGVGRLTFEEPDRAAFPCLDLAYAAAAAGGTAPAVLNAADEAAVARFLRGGLRFGDVPRLIASVVGEHRVMARPDIEDVLAADAWARRRAAEWQPAAVGGR